MWFWSKRGPKAATTNSTKPPQDIGHAASIVRLAVSLNQRAYAALLAANERMGHKNKTETVHLALLAYEMLTRYQKEGYVIQVRDKFSIIEFEVH